MGSPNASAASVARRRQRGGEFVVVADHPDAAPAAARGRLDHHRVAELGGERRGLRDVLDRSAAPRHHRDVGLFGDPFGGHLVAEPADRGAVRADERDPGLFARLRERRVLGQKAPAHPHRVDVGATQRRHHGRLVEVARPAGAIGGVDERRGPQRHRHVGLPHEPRVGVGVGEEDDGLDRFAAGLVEFGDRGQRAHGGFAAVDDAQPPDSSVHPGHAPMTARMGATTSSGGGSGSVTVRYPSSRSTGMPSSSRTMQSKPPLPSRRTVATSPARSSGHPFSRTAPTCIGSARWPSVPASSRPTVWKHNSTSRGPISTGTVDLRRQIGGEPAGRTVAVLPRRADHLIGRAMEVQPVDLLGTQCRIAFGHNGISVQRGRFGGQPHRAGEVHGPLRLIGAGHFALGRQPALGDQVVAVRAKQRGDGQRARLVAVELQRRTEIHVLDGSDVPVGRQQPGGLRERLHAHHARQHRRAVDAVVVQERPRGGVQRGAHHQAVVHARAHDLAEHRPVDGQRRRVDAAGVGELGGQRAQRARDDDLAVSNAGAQFAPDPRHACLGGQHVHPGRRHDLRDRPAGGHPDAAPGGPVERQRPHVGTGPLQVGQHLGLQVVGGAVVGLPDVAEPAGHRAERHDRAQRHGTDGVQHVEQTVTFDAEHEIELARLLVGQRVAHLDAGRVDQHVDAPAGIPYLREHLLHRIRVGEVDAVVMRSATGVFDSLDGGERGLQTLEARQLSFDQHRCGALPALTHP